MITIFIGTYNRLETLDRTIKSYKKFKTPHELVIVDNGSDNQKCIDLLTELEPKVKKIYSLGKIYSMQELTDNYNIAVADQYKGGKRWFAITDADICFDGSSPQSLNAYVRLATKTGYAVGPHTRVDAGISMGYPLRSRVLATESRLLYKQSMSWLGKIPYTIQPIDTTFHLFPERSKFERLKMNTLRVGPPYDAMHLDWYLDIFNPTEENEIYIQAVSGGPPGSWGRNWISDFWGRFQESPEDAFDFMMSVEKNKNNDLCITSFIISWCIQVGIGNQPMEESKRWLQAAVPRHYSIFWDHEKDWMEMVYDNDFSSLGWEA